MDGAVHARQIAIPDDVGQHTTLQRPDYHDAFSVPPGALAGLPAEAVLRRVLEQSRPALRRFVRTGWRFGLGFPLAPFPAPGHVLGWPISASTPQAVTGDHAVVFATFVRYEHPAASVLWAAAGPLHRRIVPALLRDAARGHR
ncbi:hypothetical protein [Saccharopolyspora rosea]|uniref:hypothetical protein n=1 Tax=Saccharopolyspora rosea TaxID=524884 RepID=UPI0021D89307|nr:hypothetical protein [Saccharopolyspora rosea]